MATDADVRATIRAKVVALARELGKKSVTVGDDDVLLEMGILDSAAVLELLVWIEGQFDLELEQDELSLDNFGSISRMAAMLSARSAG
jgi:acyl carrier protein